MSAVFNTLNHEALEREGIGFATMQTRSFGILGGPENFGSTVNQTLVTSTASTALGSYVVAYSALNTDRIASMANWDVDVSPLSVNRSARVFVGYNAMNKPPRIGSMANWNVDAIPLSVIRSARIFVGEHQYAATMGGAAVLVIPFGPSQERGVVVLRMPRKKIHTQTVSFFTGQLKRKAPRVILGGRAHGEENA